VERRLITQLTLATFWVLTSVAFSQSAGDRQTIRDLIEHWNAAYIALDAKKLAALNTPEFDIVNRLGQWTHKSSIADQEKMWDWTFKFIYKGRPGPKHTIEKIRFQSPTVATVLTRAYWKDFITLDDATKIPPHGEVDSFTVVRHHGKWKVSWLDIHNQMPPFDVKPGQALETDLPPPKASEPK